MSGIRVIARSTTSYNTVRREKDEIFTMSEADVQAYVDGGYVARLSDGSASGEGTPAAGGQNPTSTDPDDPELLWTLSTPPDKYIELYPNGPKAGLAKLILDYRAELAALDEETATETTGTTPPAE